MKTSLGLLLNGRFPQLAGSQLLFASLPLRGAGNESPSPLPSVSATVYSVAALVVALFAFGVYRWLTAWRQRTLRERDEKIFGLVDQWTKSLQKEVAERKEAQRALQASQDFILRQERLAAVGQLAAGLAHEFNNIMTIIQGHASLLMDNPNLDEESIKSLAIINDGVERTARLVKQMLAFSRKQVLQQKVIEVKDALAETEEMLRRLLGAQVVLRFEIAPALPPILADPEMFQQIILNLVGNARDAMGNGGKVTLHAALAVFAAGEISERAERRPGQFIRLSVSDTGPGMEAAVVKHLFEPFFTTKDVGKGMGLGLATVHGMVNQNKGWIEVQSEIGKGTTFDLYFPVAVPPPQKAPEKPLPLPDLSAKETVLIVEDEEVLRDMLREILSANGYRVLEAANGPDALRLWEQNRGGIELLLTDNVLPDEMSGQDLACKLREADPFLPVIFSSGYSQEMLQAKQETAAGYSFLSKPYRPAQLLEVVRDALRAAAKSKTALAAAARQA